MFQLPKAGQSKTAVLSKMQSMREQDVSWQDGKALSLVYFGGEDASDLIKEAYTMFFSENGLNPTAFPSLRQFETDVVSMSASLLGGDEHVVGNMTSGGTESILMAVVTAREWARANKPHISEPEMVLGVSIHPAFEKAAHYFGVKAVHVPVGDDFRVDVDAMQAAITPNTVLVVGSAPAYPHGIVDPIREIAALAMQHDILCHVDSCVGGFMLPFVRKLGYPVPDFDFQVPGVTSISADLHKYGYAAKGASVILYKNREIRRHQLFAYLDWPGGIYASAAMSGTRPGGAIAAAWAILNYLGEDGYLEITRRVMETAVILRKGIQNIPDLKIIGDPHMSIMAIASDKLNVYEIGDEMAERGWFIDRQQFPATLHITINQVHVTKADQFLSDLAESTAKVRKPSLQKMSNAFIVKAANAATKMLPSTWVSKLTQNASSVLGSNGDGMPQRSAAMYGMMGTLPNRGDIREVILDLLEQFTVPQSK
jgi:sphinganine-1-phosphate aldolase